ncbi:MAG: short-chain dehydrogenase, partial [bacterium]|nr:short-chain dehydrogenase [bacterium]
MNIEGSKVLVLGGWGLVGMAVCRELLTRQPREIQIHSLREEQAGEAREELLAEAGETQLTTAGGDIFGLAGEHSRRDALHLQLKAMTGSDLEEFLLYRLLVGSKPNIVIDCVNTATVIAYRDIFRATRDVYRQILDDEVRPEGGKRNISTEAAEGLLEALYVPRLIRHIQVMYKGMVEAGTRAYMKVGTSGTGGMAFNIPYT